MNLYFFLAIDMHGCVFLKQKSVCPLYLRRELLPLCVAMVIAFVCFSTTVYCKPTVKKVL